MALTGLVFIIALGAVISDSVQKQEDKDATNAEMDAARKDHNAAKVERDKLMNQITKLIDGQASATQEAKKARTETQSARAELAKAFDKALLSMGESVGGCFTSKSRGWRCIWVREVDRRPTF